MHGFFVFVQLFVCVQLGISLYQSCLWSVTSLFFPVYFSIGGSKKLFMIFFNGPSSWAWLWVTPKQDCAVFLAEFFKVTYQHLFYRVEDSNWLSCLRQQSNSQDSWVLNLHFNHHTKLTFIYNFRSSIFLVPLPQNASHMTI